MIIFQLTGHGWDCDRTGGKGFPSSVEREEKALCALSAAIQELGIHLDELCS